MVNLVDSNIDNIIGLYIVWRFLNGQFVTKQKNRFTNI